MICSHCGKEGATLRTVDDRYWHATCIVEIWRQAGRVTAPPRQRKLKMEVDDANGS